VTGIEVLKNVAWTRISVMPVARLGLLLGFSFGAWNLLWSYLYPLSDDSIGALVSFYGPIFMAWGITGFYFTRQSRRLREGVAAGTIVAFATFCALDLMVIARANIFLNELVGRSDWRALMERFPSSGFDSLRAYINWHYVTQAPVKILTASTIGAVVGAAGGMLARCVDILALKRRGAGMDRQ
jgi:hypothetical protein